MKIVGVGAGPNFITGEAISAIKGAKMIFGSKRALELAKEHINCETREITDYSMRSIPEDAVILSTGDPMFSGLGKFAKKEDTIIPGISSFQLACSRLHLDIESFCLLSAHSGNIEVVKTRLILELETSKNIFILPYMTFGVNEVSDFLRSHGLFRIIWVCERLSYPDERIAKGTTIEPPTAGSDMYCIIICKK